MLKNLRSSRGHRAARTIGAYERKYIGEPRKRPAALPVEATFDGFVEGFGGKKISDLIENKALMPRNADYIFPNHNVIAELKTLEGIFAGSEGLDQVRQAFIDGGETPSTYMDVIRGEADMPERVAALIRKRLRRGLESRVAEARKQLRMSKGMFGNENTRLLILFAMDRNPIFGHRNMLFHLATLMGSNYADEYTDGVVYMNPNTPTRVNRKGMEFSGWYPFYRDDNINAQLSGFVDLLGNSWLTHSGALTGVTNPILKLETLEEMSVALGR
jgi:hypothetical protein